MIFVGTIAISCIKSTTIGMIVTALVRATDQKAWQAPYLCCALPGLGARLHFGLTDGLVGVGRLVIYVLDAWRVLPLSPQSV